MSPPGSAFGDPIASAAWITRPDHRMGWRHERHGHLRRYVTPDHEADQSPAQVRLFDIENDITGFPLTVDALDAALNLADPRAGRGCSSWVSDGEFTGDERLPISTASTGS
ncbi:hypothetical protein [Virgisporangium aurantiacum]|uniref:Uncharacterized protein n=1 Tax=Virgisporangium aurantiacum TaxID=175570 RepID=A0A8J3ZMU2_9ACTN|nr:hypothetical protein [Virgisporangium aurantiacum]GIJ64845.1 hypothetical protein Vau01_123610 [Virgisporangium aurantiacum]